ncbi:MAG: serine/threonine-protein kinase [Gemmatimonadetes bacterium]|nr:serine/threonine-protein kinase [Gemmatimonadota bacterium]
MPVETQTPKNGGIIIDDTSDLRQELQDGLPQRYTIKRQIGRGGMATVFLAEEHQPNRQVAIKVLDPDVTTRLTRKRFLREIELISGLTHPHIVPIFAAGDAGELLYYVMPFIEGETLRHRLAHKGALDLDEALHIAWDVADALDHAHKNGVIHRDIKPENVLISGGHAVVSDFGIARAVTCAECGDEIQSITKAGIAIGTPLYMSPEQAVGDPNMDGRTDIYSLGCVLYEMVTGQPPFSGGTTFEIMARHTQERIPRVTTPSGPAPASIRQIVTKAMSKDPKNRFASAGELAGLLHQARSSSNGRALLHDRVLDTRVLAAAGLAFAAALLYLLLI